ncbi:YjgN family protein [Aliiroseovarius sp.]|uniref:YjgN family protein n=1 Tax=Aliiroseovarius sp. TaxID=1872442 RepID=UPI003BA9401D
MTPLATEYVGEKGALFRLALKTSVLTVLTLGFYRFWMKTRLRRYYWSAIRPGGAPLEYTGQPLEKLLGFLVAVVIMAFYIGVVNLILMFVSFSLFQGNITAYALSFVGVLPIIFFAQYRARRYILARTRWRGIRFGLEPGAWGYAWRAALYWALAIVSLGLLYPLKAFRLEKYRVDRTHFGSARFEQTGSWKDLYPAMKHLLWNGVIFAVLMAIGVANGMSSVLFYLIIGLPWGVYGLAYWQAGSFRILAEGKRLDGLKFQSSPRSGRIFGIWMLGGLLIQLCMTALLVGFLFAIVMALFGVGVIGGGGSWDLETQLARQPAWVQILVGIVGYFSIFLTWSVLRQVFFTLPLIKHFAEETALLNPEALGAIDQRARDEFAEAEGFADALDVGAAL